MRRPLSALLLALLLFPYAVADGSFVRMKDGKTSADAALQTAYAVYTSPTSGVEIVLYGVVHIAEEEYFDQVQRHLDSYDVVLFEGVSPTEGIEPDDTMKAIGKLQGVMGELLGLQFQKDGINYTRSNLVHADMTQQQLLDAVDGDMSALFPMAGLLENDGLKQILPMLEGGMGFLKPLMDSQPEMRDNLKRQMAGQLAGTDMAAMGGAMQEVLIEARNEVAIQVLEKQLETTRSGSIAIFYGAAHMPDFEKRLAAMGYTQKEMRWESAWTMGAGVQEEDQPAVPQAGNSEWF